MIGVFPKRAEMGRPVNFRVTTRDVIFPCNWYLSSPQFSDNPHPERKRFKGHHDRRVTDSEARKENTIIPCDFILFRDFYCLIVALLCLCVKSRTPNLIQARQLTYIVQTSLGPPRDNGCPAICIDGVDYVFICRIYLTVTYLVECEYHA